MVFFGVRALPFIATLISSAASTHGVTFLIVYWLLLTALLLPLFVARLKNAGWPPVLAGAIVTPILPLLDYQYHLTTLGLYAQKPSAWYISTANSLAIVVVGFALLLVFLPMKRKENN